MEILGSIAIAILALIVVLLFLDTAASYLKHHNPYQCLAELFALVAASFSLFSIVLKIWS